MLSLKNEKLWLFASLIGITILYLNLIWKATGDFDRLTIDLLFWVAILWLLWRRRKQLNVNSDVFSTLLGFLLVVGVLVKSITLFWFESVFLAIVPLVAALGLASIASGIRGWRQYWRELLLIGFLFFPSEIIGWRFEELFHIRELTAKFSAYVLYYIGFHTSSQDYNVLLTLPEGSFVAAVNYACTGVSMMMLMLKLALLAIAFFPLKLRQKVMLPLLSIVIGFILGVIRVCILTVVLPEPNTFDYWHGAEGAQIFSTLSILIFSCVSYFLINQSELNSLHQQENSSNVQQT